MSEYISVFDLWAANSGKDRAVKGMETTEALFSRHACISGLFISYLAESLVNGQWVAIDPTFHQIPADATHIKLVEGENPSELLPLVNLIGKLNYK